MIHDIEACDVVFCCVAVFLVLRMKFEFDILEASNRVTAYIVEVARLS